MNASCSLQVRFNSVLYSSLLRVVTFYSPSELYFADPALKL